MNHNLVIGAALLMLASATAVDAYHIFGNGGPNGSSHQWIGFGIVQDPASIVCEQDESVGPQFLLLPSPGYGGLCFMSPGYSGNPCTFIGSGIGIGGRSNGLAPDYNAPVGACLPPAGLPVITASGDWFRITMYVPTTAVPFIGSIDGHHCSVATYNFVYDATYAYTTDDGHVAGVPSSLPFLSPTAQGSYLVDDTVAPATACGAPFPFDQN